MQGTKEKIVEALADMEVNESTTKYSDIVKQKLLEAVFWYGEHQKIHQRGVNKAMGVQETTT